MDPYKILKKCKKLGCDIVFITDHNTIKGSLEAKKYEKELGIKVVLCSEIKTHYGDIIGINLTEEICNRDFDEVIDEIKSQGGISLLPHPCRDHRKINYLASKVDLIEVWNARCTPIENLKALELVKKFKKPPMAGNDAHLYSELGNVIVEYDMLFEFGKKFYIKGHSSMLQIVLSEVIGLLRRNQGTNILSVIVRALKGKRK